MAFLLQLSCSRKFTFLPLTICWEVPQGCSLFMGLPHTGHKWFCLSHMYSNDFLPLSDCSILKVLRFSKYSIHSGSKGFASPFTLTYRVLFVSYSLFSAILSSVLPFLKFATKHQLRFFTRVKYRSAIQYLPFLGCRLLAHCHNFSNIR